MLWFVQSTEIHSYPDVLSSGAMGRGDTQDLAHDFQQGKSHPMLTGLLEFLPPGASLSLGQWRASSFHLQTPPAPTHQGDTSMKAVLFGVGPPTERSGTPHGPCIPCRKQFSRALTLDPAF